MKTLAFQQNPNKNIAKSSFLTPTRLGFAISFVLHIGLVVWLFGVFHNVELQQNGDNITTIALATFQTPSNQDNVENPKPTRTQQHKKRIQKEIVKQQGKLAKQEETSPPPTPAPKAKPDEKAEEGEIIQTLSYRNGDEDENFSQIKRAIDRKNKYPNMARKRGLEGEVIVEFVIYKDGKVASIRIIKPCPHDPFNVAALNAIKKAQGDFPRLSVTTKIELPIVYELKTDGI
ncbi:energy transducer TonB [Helicobacter labetoulli]|uniref:energy transducer TonB n=1 Tax=Helicobacter labetoulli TaxID=2315333 RepID=UPI000EF653F3|nr:energy transducer TonB [Helicobacter labetoulli]